jgi:hypothetical protein
MGATESYETLVHFTRLHDVMSQRATVFIVTVVVGVVVPAAAVAVAVVAAAVAVAVAVVAVPVVVVVVVVAHISQKCMVSHIQNPVYLKAIILLPCVKSWSHCGIPTPFYLKFCYIFHFLMH